MGKPRNINEIKNFLHVRDFYDWIKDSTGDNSPATFYWFSVNFYHYGSKISSDGMSAIQDEFFTKRAQDLIDFRYSIQSIGMPDINYTGYNSQGQTGQGTLDGSNMFGTYTVLGNSYLGLESKQFSMKVLNTQYPIIERFIYPWMIECLQQTNKNSESTFPRLNMTIKFWKPNRLYENMEGVKPDFLYYVTGIFPCKIQAYRPVQSAQSGDNNRDVTFNFNQFIMIADKETAKKFNLQEFYNGKDEGFNTSWWNQMLKNWFANAASAAVENQLRKFFNNKNKNNYIKPKNFSVPQSVNSNKKLNVPNAINNFNASETINSARSIGQSTNNFDGNEGINSARSIGQSTNNFDGNEGINSARSIGQSENNFNSSETINSARSIGQSNPNFNGAEKINKADINDDKIKRNLQQILSKMRNEDENFEDIVEVDDELENSQKSNNNQNMDRSKVIRDANSVNLNERNSKIAKSILINNRQLISTGNIKDISPGDYVGLEIKEGNIDDIIVSTLSNNKSINSVSYSYLSEYAKKTDKKVSDIIKKYKSLSGKELNNFILKVAGHSSSSVINSQKTIKKAENNSVILNSNNKTDSKISDQDLDGLF